MMKTKIFNRLTAILLSLMAASFVMQAQDTNQSTSTLTRRSGSDSSRRNGTENTGPQVTQRLQSFFEDAGNSITDADRQWMRVIYRDIDLDNDKNAALYYPEDLVDNQENLFRLIMRLLTTGQLKAYEYLDGREEFTDQNLVDVKEVLDRFSILYTEGKGSTAKAPKFEIHPSDIPTHEVLSYYLIEQWEFDTRNNRTNTKVLAICPVVHRVGDFGGEPMRYPMFWVKYNDLRPWLTRQEIFLNDDNNLPTATYEDFFNLNMYEGDIYKTRNLRNRSMVQLYPDAEKRKAAQDSIQNRLTQFDKKLWVPDREEIIASNGKTKKTKKDKVSADDDDADSVSEDNVDSDSDAEVQEEKAAKRTTKRSTKKSAPKATKVKETKVKSSSSSSATRSVRKRK